MRRLHGINGHVPIATFCSTAPFAWKNVLALTLSDLLAPVAQDMRAVDAVIRARLDSDVVLIRSVGEHIVQSGGKRLRPALLLLMAKALGVGQADHASASHTTHHLLAAVIEFIHTSTLLHDDVVDESDLRRGRSTANAMFGNAASVLVGDYLYSRAFEMMVEADSMTAMRVMSQATTTIAEGEVLQLLNVHDANVSLERYMQVVRYKTAKLFEAAAQVGAIVAGASREHEAAAAVYGRHLGTAFQLIDDVLDYSGDALTLGKNVGDDLREGKPTLPLIRVMQTGSPAQRDLVRHAIETGEADFAAVAQAIEDTQALDYTRTTAKREAELAMDAARQLPTSAMTKVLLEFCTFAVDRKS